MAGIKRTATDALWSTYVRMRDKWTCQRCKKQYDPDHAGGLHCSHYFGRSNYAVRFDEDNTQALCHGCHSYLTKNPHDHREHMMERLGSDKYDQLVKRKNTALKSGEKKYYLSKEFRLIIKEKIGEFDE